MQKTKATKLNKKFKRKWVNALRSGKYKQGDSYLLDPVNNTHCCLGVACAISNIPKDELEFQNFIYSGIVRFNAETLNASDKAALNALSKEQALQDKLANFNDGNKLSFKWIASWIEKNL